MPVTSLQYNQRYRQASRQRLRTAFAATQLSTLGWHAIDRIQEEGVFLSQVLSVS